jgi:hypothetical protein
MEGEARLLRGRLVYRGQGSSAEGQTRRQRGTLVYGGGDSSKEGETRLRDVCMLNCIYVCMYWTWKVLTGKTQK